LKCCILSIIIIAHINKMRLKLTSPDFSCSPSKLFEQISMERLNNDSAVEQQQEERRQKINRRPKQYAWRVEYFPHRIYDLLEEVEERGFDDILSWCEDGKSFRIYNHKAFEETIMPFYFSGMSSYKSFRRQLNLYGIYQHQHAYSHEHFIRGSRHLCDLIVRKQTKQTNSRPKSKISKTRPKTLSKSNSNSVFTTNKNSEGNSNDINVSAKKRCAVSVSREIGNALNITRTPIAVNNSTVIDDRLEVLQAQPLQRYQQESQLLFSNSDGLQIGNIDDATATTTVSITEDVIRQNTLMKSIYDDELLTRPNPIDYSSIRLSKNEKNDRKGSSSSSSFNDNTFQSFMGQYWEDLPNGLSPTQIGDEIIATFQQQQQQHQDLQNELSSTQVVDEIIATFQQQQHQQQHC